MISLSKNDEIVLDIIDVTHEGNGVGKKDGVAVFVPETCVGDKVLVRIQKITSKFAYGKVLEIIKASEERIESDCSVFSFCGGCVFRQVKYSAECEYKYKHVKDCLNRIGGLDIIPQPIVAADEINFYRNKAQYPFSQNGKTGFFAPRSHRVVECGNCLQQPELFWEICSVVENWANENNIDIYNEQTGRGNLRHLYIRYGAKTKQVMIVPVVRKFDMNNSQMLCEMLDVLLKDYEYTLLFNINCKNTNVVLGNEYLTVKGKGYIEDILCSVRFRISPASFYQVNRNQAEKLYNIAADFAKPEDNIVLDLYCGTGTIGLTMANRAKQIVGVEIVPDAVRDAKINAENNNINNARFICGDAAEAAAELSGEGLKPDVVILDPPRKGCDADLISTVCNSFAPERVVYVSCDPATLARDLKLFKEQGYETLSAVPVDMFPRTAHVETVALLEKANVEL